MKFNKNINQQLHLKPKKIHKINKTWSLSSYSCKYRKEPSNLYGVIM